MPEIVSEGSGIEGRRIKGQARKKPGRWQNTPSRSHGRLWVRSFEFDVRGEILEPLDENSQRLSPGLSTNLEDRVVCEKAVLITIRPELTPIKVEKGSSTHKSQKWCSRRQAALKVKVCHEEILRAIERKAEEGRVMLDGNNLFSRSLLSEELDK